MENLIMTNNGTSNIARARSAEGRKALLAEDNEPSKVEEAASQLLTVLDGMSVQECIFALNKAKMQVQASSRFKVNSDV
jgi:hypothetical protein